MHPFTDITGQSFGRLTARRHEKTRATSGRSKIYWHCDCSCGGTAKVALDQLRSGKTQSCGCLQRERTSAANTRHGHAGGPSQVYRCWAQMIARCTNEKATGYHLWGGRGIKVCERWHDFPTFLADVGEPPSRGHSIDRFPNRDGNYEPGNVRWATREEQNNNTRKNHFVTFKGETLTVAQWAARIGIRPQLLHARLARLGWSVERALTERPNPRRQASKLQRN
jgi:hypothetical protein